MGFDVRCKKCDREFSAPARTTKFCPECKKEETIELRAVWEHAYFAALMGVSGTETTTSGPCDSDDAVKYAALAADLTVAGWPFGRDDVVRKAVQG